MVKFRSYKTFDYLQVDAPDNFSSLVDVVRRRFLEVCNLYRIHPAFQANNGCLIARITSSEVVQE